MGTYFSTIYGSTGKRASFLSTDDTVGVRMAGETESSYYLSRGKWYIKGPQLSAGRVSFWTLQLWQAQL